MPSGPGVIPEERIAEIAALAPPGVATFLLTCRTNPAEIVAQRTRTGVGVLQLCDEPDPGARVALRQALPGVKIVQVIHVQGAASVDAARAAARPKSTRSSSIPGGRTSRSRSSVAPAASTTGRRAGRSAMPSTCRSGWRAASIQGTSRGRSTPCGPSALTSAAGSVSDGRLDARLLAEFMREVSNAS